MAASGQVLQAGQVAVDVLVVAGAQRDLDQPLQRLLLGLRARVLGDGFLQVVRGRE